jgi:beta-lactamase superfamily II metal-dependent hydrolase
LKCEIEFLAVGEGAKAGDAIVIRYGDVNAYELMLIDGGHAETGDEIVAHLKEHFGPNPVLEHVVLTHSDADHASGLRTVLQEISANNLWVQVPPTCRMPLGQSQCIPQAYPGRWVSPRF